MTASDYVAEYLGRYREGNRDDAFFGLLETNFDVLPELMVAYRAESDCTVQGFLVEVIWQYRQQSAIPFLGEALRNSDPIVWRQALDGLVVLASPVALEVLRSALQSSTDEVRRWVEEAIEQTEEQLQRLC